LLSNQFGESIDEEINAELDSILANSMPEIPNHEIPVADKKQREKKNVTAEKTKKMAVEAD
jgi:hypothetical protein